MKKTNKKLFALVLAVILCGSPAAVFASSHSQSSDHGKKIVENAKSDQKSHNLKVDSSRMRW